MRDSNPTAIQRLLTLRQFPGFANAELGELATVAENVVERVFPTGTTVAAPPGRMPAIHLVVEGRLRAGEVTWGPRELFGALEVMASRPVLEPAVAVADTRTLQLAAADFAELLEDNFGMLSSVRRSLAARALVVDERSTPRIPTDPSPSPQLGMVERLIALRQLRPLAGGRIQALAALAQAAGELTLPAGAVASTAGDYADAALPIIDGVLRAWRPGREPRILGRGDAIGMLETLAELPHDATVEALTPVRLLRLPGIALFDVMEDHTDLALAVIAQLAGQLLDTAPVVARTGASVDTTLN